ncbi:MAG: site-specific DNA-methyltransferase [Agarilytica sp.]
MQPISVDTVEQWALDRLIPYARNARTHSDAQISKLMGGIKEFGFVNPILVGEDNVIIAGHGRLLAAQKLGMDKVPVIILKHLSDVQKRALVISDNRIADDGGWSEELLQLELADLDGLEFDLDVLGFDDEELENLLDFDSDDSVDADANIPEPEDNPISQAGDIWVLGDHRLMCGDSTKSEDVDALMEGGLADMCFSDPPYNVDYGNSAKDKMRENDRRIMNDNLGNGFYDFLLAAMQNAVERTKGCLYVCMSSSELDVLQSAFRDAGGRWSTFIIWAKNHFTLGRSDYQRQYEPILYGWKEGNDHFWCGDRNQSDVWFFDKPVRNDLHPTMKPVALVERAIKNSSKTHDIILDLFGGGGSTMIACENTKRHARLMELDPKYVDVIIKRWQILSGSEAVRVSDKQTYDIAAQKHVEPV